MKRSSKIYIAGHRGLVGSAILRLLKAEGYANIVTRTHTELDLTKQADVEAFFESEKPEYVFLAAARVGGIWANMNYPAEFIYDNMAIALNVVHAAHKYGTKKLLNLGSSCIYPKHAPQPMKEEYLLADTLEPTNEPYAIAKITAIKLCRYYNEQYSTNFISIMPTNLYGPNDNFDLETSHVLPALIRKFHLTKRATKGDWEDINRDESLFGKIPADIMANLVAMSCGQGHGNKVPSVHRLPFTVYPKTTNQPITNNSNLCSPLPVNRTDGPIPDDLSRRSNSKGGSEVKADHSHLTNKLFNQVSRSEAASEPRVTLWGTGQPYREFLHVGDLAAATIYLMKNCDYKDIGEHVNVGSGEDLTIKEYAEMVKEIVGFEGEVIWDKTKPDGTPRKLLDISRIKKLGWQPKISLEKGIAQTYEWYKGIGKFENS